MSGFLLVALDEILWDKIRLLVFHTKTLGHAHIQCLTPCDVQEAGRRAGVVGGAAVISSRYRRSGCVM